MAKNKKKVYKNPYKTSGESGTPASGEKQGTGGKKKLTYKSYFVAVSILGGFAAFFMANQIIAAVDLVLFLISGILMGKQNLVFLGFGAILGVLIAMLNQADYLISIALVWALFYTVLMVSGFFFMRRARKQ